MAGPPLTRALRPQPSTRAWSVLSPAAAAICAARNGRPASPPPPHRPVVGVEEYALVAFAFEVRVQGQGFAVDVMLLESWPSRLGPRLSAVGGEMNEPRHDRAFVPVGHVQVRTSSWVNRPACLCSLLIIGGVVLATWQP